MYLDDFPDGSDALCDRFDRMQALYYVSVLWHGGAASILYRLGCRSGFIPGPTSDGTLNREEDAQARHYAARYLLALRQRMRDGRSC